MGISLISAGEPSFEDHEPILEGKTGEEEKVPEPLAKPTPPAAPTFSINQIHAQIQQIEEELQNDISSQATLNQFLATDDKLKAVMNVLKGVVEKVKASGQTSSEFETALGKVTSMSENLNTQMVDKVMGDIKNLKK